MPLSLLIGVLTLVPALAAVLIVGLGAARRALSAAVFALAALGALVPVICLLMLAPYLGSGEPLRVTLFGGSLASNAWFSAVYRADAFGVYAGIGLTFLVIPLLLWLAWRGHLAPAAPPKPEPESTATTEADGGADATPESPEAAETMDVTDTSETSIWGASLPVTGWAGVALTLAAETAALTVLFADNILWLTLAWLALAALVWGLGELGADMVDRAGLGLALAGPVLWAIAMLLGAVPAKSPTLFGLMGGNTYTPVHVIVLAVAVALAGGAYPFIAWVRRRAALTTPAGLGALLLVLLPITLFVAARAYSAIQNSSGQWPEIGQAAPPVYGGIALAVLGALTVGVCGLLALDRRDVRILLAYLAVAQIGWGMLALSTGEPASLPGVLLVLAGSVFGLGAMLAATFAGGTLSDDDEPDGAGPRVFGARFSPAALFAWCVGAVSLIGVPLFGGFAAREMISAAALHLGNLTAPLTGIAWAGDGLLALALARATAPAFTQLTAEDEEEEAEESEGETLADVAPSDEPEDLDGEEEMSGEESEEGEGAAERGKGARAGGIPRGDIRMLPALIFGVLAVALGIAPQLLLSFGGTLAAGTLTQPHAVDAALRSTQVGYATGVGQWLPGIAWGAAVVLALLFYFARPDTIRTVRQPALAEQPSGEAMEEHAPEMASQSEPADTWKDLRAVFVSPLTLPAGEWLLAGTDIEEGEVEEAEETELKAEEEAETPVAAEADAPTTQAAEAPNVMADEGADVEEALSDEAASAEAEPPAGMTGAGGEETPPEDTAGAAAASDSGEQPVSAATTQAAATEIQAGTEAAKTPPEPAGKPPVKRPKRASATSSARASTTPAPPASDVNPTRKAPARDADARPAAKSPAKPAAKSGAKPGAKPASSKSGAPAATKGGKSSAPVPARGGNKKNTGGRA